MASARVFWLDMPAVILAGRRLSEFADVLLQDRLEFSDHPRLRSFVRSGAETSRWKQWLADSCSKFIKRRPTPWRLRLPRRRIHS